MLSDTISYTISRVNVIIGSIATYNYPNDYETIQTEIRLFLLGTHAEALAAMMVAGGFRWRMNVAGLSGGNNAKKAT